MLEVFDELGIKPSAIAGTSIGAVIGSLYASGLSAKEIKNLVDDVLVVTKSDSLIKNLLGTEIFQLFEFIDPALGQGGLLKGERLLAFLYEKISVSHFEQLPIPLKVVATDLKTGEEVVFEKGALLPAVQASMALPGIFAPVEKDGRILIDGGAVNPVPYDLLASDCDILVAIDVGGNFNKHEGAYTYFDIIFATFTIMQHSIAVQKQKILTPDFYIRPQIVGIRTLQFNKAQEIYRQALAAKEEFKQNLSLFLEGIRV